MIREILLNLLKSYISYSGEKVKLYDVYSGEQLMNNCVRHGTVLGSLLFII